MISDTEALASIALMIVGLLIVAVGALTAWESANVIKRVGGVALLGIGGFSAALGIGAPESVLIAAGALALAQTIVGAVILVRVQEAYGWMEAGEIDAADADADADRPGSSP